LQADVANGWTCCRNLIGDKDFKAELLVSIQEKGALHLYSKQLHGQVAGEPGRLDFFEFQYPLVKPVRMFLRSGNQRYMVQLHDSSQTKIAGVPGLR
jgi:hypothetical protein